MQVEKILFLLRDIYKGGIMVNQKEIWGNITKHLSGILSVVHPFLLAVFPILFLYASNINEAGFTEALFPMLISLAIAGLLFAVLFLLTKNKYKAALIVSLVTVLFYTFGYITDGIPGLGSNKWILLIVYGILLAAGVFGVLKTKKKMIKFNEVISVFATTLIVISLFNIGVHYIKKPKEQKVGSEVKAGSFKGEKPDIYYIILDAYAREDMLKSFYGFDNSEFMSYLKDKGFYVADESSTNYNKTVLSIPSSLNYDYLPLASEDPMDVDPAVVVDMAKDNKISRVLKGYGYNIVQFSNGYNITKQNDYVDLILSRSDIKGSEFVASLLNSTVLNVFKEYMPNNSITQTFETIPRIKDMVESPRFVFAHILCPHPPYVYDQNGELPKPVSHKGLDQDTKCKMYLDQLTYTNKKVEEVVDKLLSQEEKPIIIIQSDHGMWYHSSAAGANVKLEYVKEYTSILNAYYFPDGKGEDSLYESITPVNSFRVVLNSYFGEELPLLEDKVHLVVTKKGKMTENGPIRIFHTSRSVNKITSGLEEIVGFLKLETNTQLIKVYSNHLISYFKNFRFRECYKDDKNITFGPCEYYPRKSFPGELTESAQKQPTYVVWSEIGPNPQIPSTWPLKLLKEYHDESAGDLYLYEVTASGGK